MVPLILYYKSDCVSIQFCIGAVILCVENGIPCTLYSMYVCTLFAISNKKGLAFYTVLLAMVLCTCNVH